MSECEKKVKKDVSEERVVQRKLSNLRIQIFKSSADEDQKLFIGSTEGDQYENNAQIDRTPLFRDPCSENISQNSENKDQSPCNKAIIERKMK